MTTLFAKDNFSVRDEEEDVESNGTPVDPASPARSPIAYADAELERIQRQSMAKLTRDDVAMRKGAKNSDMVYLETWKAIELANELFKFNGWSDEILSVSKTYEKYHSDTGGYDLCIVVTMRITLRCGNFHEDVGTGSIENCKSIGLYFFYSSLPLGSGLLDATRCVQRMARQSGSFLSGLNCHSG